MVRSTLLCGEKGQKQERRRRGGVLVEGGGEVEHVPDSERPFRGRGLWLRLACGIEAIWGASPIPAAQPVALLASGIFLG